MALELQSFLELASRDHKHLCPRQVLGVRIGLKGMAVLGMDETSARKTLLVISETDGCFIDGIIAVTKCTVGHRNLRVADYGKIAATFANVKTGQAVRIAPKANVRERASDHAPGETRHYFAQLQGYQVMPDDELLNVQNVILNPPIETILSRAGVRVNCSQCGEEIINGREVITDKKPYCIACAHEAYYHLK